MRVVLTDIEGTTTSISFVTDVLFPYARARIPAWVHAHAAEPEVAAALVQVRAEAGVARTDEVVEVLLRWMDEDRKATPLKTIQGLIWEQGYANGDLQSHLYPDVIPSLRAWRAAGLTLAVYSSGSERAQRLLFAHSPDGDLTPLFSAFFDTRVGGKREARSYQAIAAALDVPTAEVLFLSDVLEELDAAAAAGMETRWLVREGAGGQNMRHQMARSFEEISLR